MTQFLILRSFPEWFVHMRTRNVIIHFCGCISNISDMSSQRDGRLIHLFCSPPPLENVKDLHVNRNQMASYEKLFDVNKNGAWQQSQLFEHHMLHSRRHGVNKVIYFKKSFHLYLSLYPCEIFILLHSIRCIACSCLLSMSSLDLEGGKG